MASTAVGRWDLASSACFLASGTASALSVKFMYMSCVSHSAEPATCPAMLGNTTAQEHGCSINSSCTAWEHPVRTVAFVNFLLMLCLPTYHVSRLQEHANYSELEDCEPDSDQAQRSTRYLPRGNQLRKCFLAGCCSSVGWILQYWGLTFLYASTFVMVKATAMLLITAARNMYFLGMGLQVHHAYGMLLVLGERPAQQQSALLCPATVSPRFSQSFLFVLMCPPNLQLAF